MVVLCFRAPLMSHLGASSAKSNLNQKPLYICKFLITSQALNLKRRPHNCKFMHEYYTQKNYCNTIIVPLHYTTLVWFLKKAHWSWCDINLRTLYIFYCLLCRYRYHCAVWWKFFVNYICMTMRMITVSCSNATQFICIFYVFMYLVSINQPLSTVGFPLLCFKSR